LEGPCLPTSAGVVGAVALAEQTCQKPGLQKIRRRCRGRCRAVCDASLIDQDVLRRWLQVAGCTLQAAASLGCGWDKAPARPVIEATRPQMARACGLRHAAPGLPDWLWNPVEPQPCRLLVHPPTTRNRARLHLSSNLNMHPTPPCHRATIEPCANLDRSFLPSYKRSGCGRFSATAFL
jgi:hypothetical protein